MKQIIIRILLASLLILAAVPAARAADPIPEPIDLIAPSEYLLR